MFRSGHRPQYSIQSQRYFDFVVQRLIFNFVHPKSIYWGLKSVVVGYLFPEGSGVGLFPRDHFWIQGGCQRPWGNLTVILKIFRTKNKRNIPHS